MTELSRHELRLVHTLLNATRDAARDGLQSKIRVMIAERAGIPDWGPVVYSVEIPLELAPTLNRYGSLEGWQAKRIRKDVDLLILAQFHRWPTCLLRDQPRRRAVLVTRYSSAEVDEIGCDVLGGKIPIDRLVRAGVLAGDSRKHLVRDAAWKPVPPSGGRVLVEVHELVS